MFLMLANGEDERFWERNSEVYVRNRSSGAQFSRVRDWLAERVGPKDSLLEIGPGPGIFTRFLAGHCAQVTAVEPSPANAAWLRRELCRFANLHVVQEKWEEAVTAPHDVVFSAGTLYVFPEIESALRKMLAHARAKVLLVTMDETRSWEQEAAAALGLPQPVHLRLSALFIEVLRSLGMRFTCTEFSEEAEYSYPHFEALFELWQGSLGLREEHRFALAAFCTARGLLADAQAAVRLPRQFTTYMLDIAAEMRC